MLYKFLYLLLLKTCFIFWFYLTSNLLFLIINVRKNIRLVKKIYINNY